MNGIALNYMALYVSILAKVPPEGAFSRLGEYHQLDKEAGRPGRPRVCSDADVENMVKLQNSGWTLKKIGEAYGVDPAYSCRIMSDWRKVNGQTRVHNRNTRKANHKKE